MHVLHFRLDPDFPQKESALLRIVLYYQIGIRRAVKARVAFPTGRPTMTKTRSYCYRSARIPTRVPVLFLADGEIFSGCSLDLSVGGARLTLNRVLQVGTTGKLTMRGASGLFECSARIVHIDGDEAGFCFLPGAISSVGPQFALCN